MRRTTRCLLAGFALATICTGALAQFTIDFSTSRGTGAASDKVLVENIRVQVPVPNPFNPSASTVVESVYNVMFAFDRATLHLVPFSIQTASGSTCGTVNVNVFNALQGTVAPLSGATVSLGSRTSSTNASGAATFSGVAEGNASVTVSSNGFNPATQAITVSCAQANTVAVALSPATGTAGGLNSGQFRTILTWGTNPSDLDSHMTGPISGSSSRFHVYYSNRSGGTGSSCALDVDDTTSFGPETVTCPATSTTGALVPGIYRYSIHHYSGSSTICASGTNVRLEFGNGTVYNYTPPSTGCASSNDVWTVFEATVASNGTVSVAPVNTITRVSGSSAVSRPKEGAIQYGEPESSTIFQGLVK